MSAESHDAESSAPVVHLGSRVRLRGPGMDGGEIAVVRSGNDIELFHVSARTPLERALLGRRAGDRVTVHTRGANASFVIVAVDG
jgi:transcription elongation GreA/GreB family factor